MYTKNKCVLKIMKYYLVTVIFGIIVLDTQWTKEDQNTVTNQ